MYYRILREQGLPFPFESARPFGHLLAGLGIALIAGWASATTLWFTGRRRAACGALLALGAVIAGLVVGLLHVVEPHHSAKAVAAAITGRAGADDVVVHEGSLEYSAALPYYTGRRIVVVNGERGDLDWSSRRPEASGWFVDGAGLARLWTGSRRVFLVTQHQPPRTVTAQLPAETVHVLGKFGSRWLYSNRGS